MLNLESGLLQTGDHFFVKKSEANVHESESESKSEM